MDSNGELIYHPRHALVNSGIIENRQKHWLNIRMDPMKQKSGKSRCSASVRDGGIHRMEDHSCDRERRT